MVPEEELELNYLVLPSPGAACRAAAGHPLERRTHTDGSRAGRCSTHTSPGNSSSSQKPPRQTLARVGPTKEPVPKDCWLARGHRASNGQGGPTPGQLGPTGPHAPSPRTSGLTPR